MKTERLKEIPKRKMDTVRKLSDLMKKKNTTLIASIKNIPASQFQEISKKLRNKAIIKVPKKNLIFRAIENRDSEEFSKMKKHIVENIALLFSDLDSFELALELVKNKRPARAKIGQEAQEDIVIPEGPTDLIPGPAISELGALGIQIKIQNGKINIKEAKIIVKKGEKISRNAANIMNKLDIKPFSIGFSPILAFDNKQGKLYLNIKIDIEETKEELKQAFGKALPFAVEIGYVSNDTIIFLLQKSERQAKALKKIAEVKQEVNVEQSAQKDKLLTEQSNPELQGEANKINEKNTQENKTELSSEEV